MPVIGEKKLNPKNPNEVAVWNGNSWVIGISSGAKFTDSQAKANGYASLAQVAEQQYQNAIDEGYNPASINAVIADKIPFFASGVNQKGEDAKDSYTEAYARLFSGGAIPEPERKRFAKQSFPRFGQNFEDVEPEARKRREAIYKAQYDAAGDGRKKLPNNLPLGKKYQNQIPQQAPQRVINKAKTNFTPMQLQTIQGIKVGGVAGSRTNPRLPTTQQQYNAIPAGQWVIDEDGYLHRKGE